MTHAAELKALNSHLERRKWSKIKKKNNNKSIRLHQALCAFEMQTGRWDAEAHYLGMAELPSDSIHPSSTYPSCLLTKPWPSQFIERKPPRVTSYFKIVLLLFFLLFFFSSCHCHNRHLISCIYTWAHYNLMLLFRKSWILMWYRCPASYYYYYYYYYYLQLQTWLMRLYKLTQMYIKINIKHILIKIIGYDNFPNFAAKCYRLNNILKSKTKPN